MHLTGHSRLRIWTLSAASALVWPSLASGLTITGYTSATHDRFTSGFPSSPQDNANAGFIGKGYDWSGVAWSATDATKGFALLSPQHYLVARHYGGATNLKIAGDNGLATATQSSVTNTGYGVLFNGQTVPDTAVGRLVTPFAHTTGLPRYAVMDINTTSTANTINNYANMPLLVYGRGANGSSSPRIGSATLTGANLTGTTQLIATDLSSVTLQAGDSGSPLFHGWTNPNGDLQLTLVGNNAAVDTTTNFLNYFNFLGTYEQMAAMNTILNPDGYALRVAGYTTHTWVGTSSNVLTNRGAWGLSAPTAAPSDKFVLFNGATAGNSRVVNVSANANQRGLYFKSATGTNAFTFSGTSTLTIGRGGLTNYDADQQVFTAHLALGDSQYWDVGTGGIAVSTLNTAGHLLEISGSGSSVISGIVSGTGSLALSGGQLTLSGANTYTGGTWVHGGKLIINGSVTSTLTVGSDGTLGGSGSVSGDAVIAGLHSPGNSPGIQTFANNLTYNTGSSILWELSANTTSNSPIAFDQIVVGGNLTFSGVTTLYLDFNLAGSSVNWADTFWSSGRSWVVLDVAGATTNTGNLTLATLDWLDAGSHSLSSVRQGAVFALSKVGSDIVLTYSWTPIPEPSTYGLGMAALALALAAHRRRLRP